MKKLYAFCSAAENSTGINLSDLLLQLVSITKIQNKFGQPDAELLPDLCLCIHLDSACHAVVVLNSGYNLSDFPLPALNEDVYLTRICVV